jgi:uncharacterized protein YbjT (DUF2867 family)
MLVIPQLHVVETTTDRRTLISEPARHRIAVIGATGRTGRALVDRALAAGHRIVALARTPPSSSRPGLEWVQGDVLTFSDVARVVAGADAVVCCLGSDGDSPLDLCGSGTQNIVDAMKLTGVRRLICQTGAMIGHDPSKLGGFYRALRRAYRFANRADAADRTRQERIVMDSGLDWTLVRPPRLTDGDSHGHELVGTDLHVNGRAHAHRRDVASVLLRAVEDDAWNHQGVCVVSPD